VAGVNTAPASAPRSGGVLSPLARDQYRALAWVQFRMFLNALRTRRGSLELGARILSGFLFTAIALGPSVGLGVGAWAAAAHNHPAGISALLWVLFLAWQFFASLAPALAGQNPELGHLLRYPVGFGSWILLYLIYGIAAPSTVIGLLWTTAIAIGVGIARPDQWAWIALTLALFAFFNLLLSRMILAWIERWLAQRRTREIVTAVFLFLALGAQALNPALHRSSHQVPHFISQQKAIQVGSRIWNAQSFLPPGLATTALTGGTSRQILHRTASLGLLGLYIFGAGGLLAVRLRSESRGENLSEAPRRSARPTARKRLRPAIDFSGPTAAIVEKDLRYLLRSGPMLYNLAAPLVMVFVFGGAFRGGGQFSSSIRLEYALPIAMVWAFLGLARLISNNLGMEGDGIQFYFLSPTPLRTVVLGKNFLHLLLFLLEALLISAVVVYRFGLPTPSVAAATLAWLLFAVPANFAVGNLLSITMPYRINMTRIRREQGAVGNGLSSFVTQLAILAVGAVVIAICTFLDRPWLATPVFLVLAAVSSLAYLRILGNVDRMVQSRMESLTLEVMKTK